jgi:multidrug transporter EmrE-like cation transporter
MNETCNLKEPLLSTSSRTINGHAIGLLCITIILETSGTLLLKKAFDNYIYMSISFLLYFSSLTLFAFTLKCIPLSIAYTTWCTFGTVGVSIMSKIIYNEELSGMKWACIAATVPCIVGLYILP